MRNAFSSFFFSFLAKNFSLQLYFYQLILFDLSNVKLSRVRLFLSSCTHFENFPFYLFYYFNQTLPYTSSLWEYSPFLRWRRRYLFINTIIRKRPSKLGDQCTYVHDIDDTILKTLITGCPASSRNRFGGGFCTWKQ